jgi:hypothetical protein
MTDTPETDDRQFTRLGETWEAQLLAGVSVAAREPISHGEAREANQTVSDVVAKLATLTVRRMCNQHDCSLPATGACGHEDARRDADYLRHMLDVLGLPGSFEDVTAEDRANLLDAMAQKPTVGVDKYSEVTEN